MVHATTGTEAAELHYAPGGPARRRRLLRRVLLGSALVVAILVAWRYAPDEWQRWRVRSITEQARTFTLPRGRVIYEADPSVPRAAAVVAEDPRLLAELAGITERGVGTLAIFGNASAPDRPLAFLHERTSPKGLRRIVAVRIVAASYTPADGGTVVVKYTSMVIEPREGQAPAAHGVGEGRGPDRGLLPATAAVEADGPAEPGRVRIFAA